MESNPFADYLWMGEMEKFDEEIEAEIEKELLEEEFIRSCIEQLLEEEEEQTVYFKGSKQELPKNKIGNQQLPEEQKQYEAFNRQMENLYLNYPQAVATNGGSSDPLPNNFNRYNLQKGYHQQLPQKPIPNSAANVKSSLNPNAVPFVMNPAAKEFVPRSTPPPLQQSRPQHQQYHNPHAGIPVRFYNTPVPNMGDMNRYPPNMGAPY